MKCETPLVVNKQTVPCGKCSACITRKRDNWVMRLYEEAKVSTSTFFITLTYDDEHLVYGEDAAVLNYSDLRSFHRSARKLGFVYKYFAVGEYGELNSRPHYHLLIFTNQIDFDWNKFLSIWKLGLTDIGTCTEASMKYCTKDMLKEVELFSDVPRPLRPHILASNGLGESYVDAMKNWHNCSIKSLPDRCYLPENGRKHNLPRYLRNKIYTKAAREYIRFAQVLDRSDVNLSLAAGNAKALADEADFIKAYYEGVRQRKEKIQKINHFNKKL